MMNERKRGSAEAFVSVVAENIRALRERKGISLSELAQSAGIGKSTLSMLESGKANPNIETLWAIAAAMGVTFGEIVEERVPDVRIVRAGEGLRVDAQHAAFHAELLVSSGGRSRFEVYLLESEHGRAREAAAHHKGVVEHIYVVAGRLRVGPKSAPVELAPGDIASFAADVPHVYEALRKGMRAVLVMEYTG